MGVYLLTRCLVSRHYLVTPRFFAEFILSEILQSSFFEGLLQNDTGHPLDGEVEEVPLLHLAIVHQVPDGPRRLEAAQLKSVLQLCQPRAVGVAGQVLEIWSLREASSAVISPTSPLATTSSSLSSAVSAVGGAGNSASMVGGGLGVA